MKKVFNLVLLITSFYSLAQSNLSQLKSEEIDDYIEYFMNNQKIPGLALALIDKGEVIKKKSYGLASLEYKVPVTDSSVFWLASISKHFTATAIMQLQEKGILNIDEKIKRYLPDIPENWNAVTLRHLLTHTSGLPASGYGNERGSRSARGTYLADQMYENAKKDTLSFTPGSDFLYSDEGIFLLGYIIHKVSGMSFKEYFEKMIFQASGMENAYLMDQFKIHTSQVSGYSIRNGEIIPDRNSWRLIDTEINAAGGIYATIDDMINWEKAILGDEILSDESKDLMWESHKLNNGRRTFYGFCWNSQVIQNKRIIYHPGVAGTEYMRFVDDSISIIVLTNQAKYERAISQKIAEIIGISPIMEEKDIKTATVVTTKPEEHEFRDLIGSYNFKPNENYYSDKRFTMDIVKKNDALFIEYPSNYKYKKSIKLGKLDNGRWIQLSWEPTFLEVSYEIQKKDSGEVSLKVFEDYNLGYDLHVGDMRKMR